MMDSFLHLPPSQFKKLFSGRSCVPVVSVIKDDLDGEAELAWAVESDSARVNLKVSSN